MRTRLFLGFVALIVTSALATMVIGYAVFGQKVEELARSKVTLYVKVAEQVLGLRMEKMRLMAMYLAAQTGTEDLPASLVAAASAEVPIDFIVCFSEDRMLVVRERDSGGQDEASRELFSGGMVEEWTRRPFGRFLRQALASRGAISGLISISQGELKAVGVKCPVEEAMVFLAAAPTSHFAGGVLLGRIINGRNEILKTTESIIGSSPPETVDATIFRNDLRIATTLGDEVLGTAADPKVGQTVLRKGEQFTGKAKVLNQFFFTSYTPLFDLDKKIIGMIGAGTNEDVYKEVRHRTSTLFSSLIVGGMLFGFLVTYLFSTLLMRPVAHLAEGMSRVAEGDLNYKVRLGSPDELGRLAQAFNKMVKAVKQRDLKLMEMTENRLSAVEKQISIGRLAAGVAHEINNPLTAILGLSKLMYKHTSEDDPKREDLDIIVAETTRCREIVRSLLDFARESPANTTVVDINQIIKDTMTLANKYDAMEKARVVMNLSPVPLYVNGDSKMLQQVFTNLLLNAAEAIDESGEIRISTEEDSSGSFIHLEIEDTGKGIPREHLGRVFEPFFTTKGMGKGTGLGLSVSLGIVQKHEGTIEIQSEEGRGTTVTVILPRVL